MRVLVTRAIEDAARTAQTLRAKGHEPIIAPLRKTVLLTPDLPENGFAGLIASSRHAFAHPGLPHTLKSLPCYCVGEKTAEAARASGFAQAEALGGEGARLADLLVARLPGGSRLLYLAGRPRHEALEKRLAEHGMRVETREVYAMERVQTLPSEAVAVLDSGTLDAVLHYSAESARALVELATQANLAGTLTQPLHICLSEAVAAALPATFRRAIATQPREEALLAQLDHG